MPHPPAAAPLPVHPPAQGLLIELGAEDVDRNLEFTEEEFEGGEARVHLLRWRARGPASAAAAAAAAAPGDEYDGARVAVKVYHSRREDGRGFVSLDDEEGRLEECASRTGARAGCGR